MSSNFTFYPSLSGMPVFPKGRSEITSCISLASSFFSNLRKMGIKCYLLSLFKLNLFMSTQFSYIKWYKQNIIFYALKGFLKKTNQYNLLLLFHWKHYLLVKAMSLNC
jgi:hypothetical protein